MHDVLRGGPPAWTPAPGEEIVGEVIIGDQLPGEAVPPPPAKSPDQSPSDLPGNSTKSSAPFELEEEDEVPPADAPRSSHANLEVQSVRDLAPRQPSPRTAIQSQPRPWIFGQPAGARRAQ
jgi:hypothetical protein